MAKEWLSDKINAIPKALKILLFLFPITGWALSSFYRFVKYYETREIITLVVGVIGLVSGLGIVFGWADAISVMKYNKPSFFAE